MKTKCFIMLSCIFLVSCSLSKKQEMEKDAESLIEASQNAEGWSSMSTIFISFESLKHKYQGAEMVEFMGTLRAKVKEKKGKGEDCGIIELMYMFDKDFKDLDKDDNTKSSKK